MSMKGRMILKEKRVAWHPAFVNAMKLELISNEEELIYDTERELNQQPLRIDLLVIKKTSNVQIKNEIGHIFRGHNLIEYKSEDDEMNIDTLFKVIAYGCLYKAYAKDVDGISADDITLSLVRKRKPKKLFSYFEKEQFTKLLSAVHDLKQKQEKELLRFFKPDLDDEIDAAILQTTENITQDMTRKTVLRMLKKKKYDYEEIAEIAGTTVDTVKQIEESEIQFVS